MITSYATLQSELAGWLNRTDLTEQIKTCIQFAESKIRSVAQVQWCEAVTTLTATAGAETLALPTNFNGVKSLHLVIDPKYPLRQMSLAALREAYRQNVSGRPRYYALTDEQIVFGPAPDVDYDLSLTYWEFAPLSDSVADNPVLLRHPGIYQALSLSEAYMLLNNPDMAAMWRQKAQIDLDAMAEDDAGYSWGAAGSEVHAL